MKLRQERHHGGVRYAAPTGLEFCWCRWLQRCRADGAKNVKWIPFAHFAVFARNPTVTWPAKRLSVKPPAN